MSSSFANSIRCGARTGKLYRLNGSRISGEPARQATSGNAARRGLLELRDAGTALDPGEERDDAVALDQLPRILAGALRVSAVVEARERRCGGRWIPPEALTASKHQPAPCTTRWPCSALAPLVVTLCPMRMGSSAAATAWPASAARRTRAEARTGIGTGERERVADPRLSRHDVLRRLASRPARCRPFVGALAATSARARHARPRTGAGEARTLAGGPCAVSTTSPSPSRRPRRNGLCPSPRPASMDRESRCPAHLSKRKRPMVERKLRPAPSQVLSLPQRKPARTDKAAGRAPASNAEVSKLFVLDTNVLMHDPTSLFRFEEHDIYVPMFVLEELDANKKGVTEVARNARQASPLPRRARLRPRLGRRARRHRRGHRAGHEVQRRGHRAAVPADRDDRRVAAAVARQRQGRQPDPRRRDAPRAAASQAPRDPGVQGHQHADQGARAGPARRGLLQRQGARGHRPPLHRHAGAAGGLLGPPRQGHGELAAGRPHALPRDGPAGAGPARRTSSSTSERDGETPFYAIVKEVAGKTAVLCRRSRTTPTRRTTSGASPRATASRTSRSTC